MIVLPASPAVLRTAILSFSAGYHSHYSRVRLGSQAFIAGGVGASVADLARDLKRALDAYGAGRRGAPHTAGHASIVSSLCRIRPALRRLTSCAASGLSISPGGVRMIGGATARVSAFDRDFIDALNDVATNCLLHSRNVTYPMKTLMLLTGIIPAFDSQVRGGMALGGFSGMKATVMLLPPVPGNTIAKKILFLPFHFASAFARAPAVASCVAGTPLVAFPGDLGRILDVLLFSQNSVGAAAYVSWVGPGRWY